MGFIYEVVNQLRLVWRLFWDDGVRWWHRTVFFIPLIYLLIPFRYDLLIDLAPVVGLLDDWLLALLCSYVFTFLCPRRIVRRQRAAIALSDPDPDVRERARRDEAMLEALSPIERMEVYRHPRESLALALSVVLLIGLATLGGMVLGALLALSVGISFGLARLAQAQILRKAVRADPESVPQVYASLNRCYAHLPYVPVDVLVIDSPRLNAYTFGLDHPYTLIVCSGLLESLSEDELTTVIGHELGHALYEHTFLSSLLGGMLHRRGLVSMAWSLVFLRWCHLAERTADRIAYLSSGQLDVCIRTMIKLATGANGEIDAEIDEVLAQVYANERSELFERLDGLVRTHPNLVARVRALIDFDAELFALDVENWLAADG